MHLLERPMQAKHAVSALNSEDNVVLGGDMSWDDDADLPFPLPAGWCDACAELKQETGSYNSWTYDSFWVEKLGEFNGHKVPNSWMKKRSDRFVCKLQDYTLITIGLIDRNAYKFRSLDCPRIMPSCHRGLVLTIVPNEHS
jgi:tyrosyl-DNA phosphodiesterase 2